MKKDPISTKRAVSLDEISEMATGLAESSQFDIDPKLKKLLDSKKLAVRWISGSEFKKNNGFNKNGWIPLRDEMISSSDIESTGGIYGGFNAEGYYVRGDLVLAIRSNAVNEAHRKRLRAAARQAEESTNVKAKAKGFKGTGVEKGNPTDNY